MSGPRPDPPRTSPDTPPAGAPTLCLGDAAVELICERPLDDVSAGDAFAPHLGGAGATVAVTAARLGARVGLAGGAGDDVWGGWLRDRLAREGVDVSLFELRAGAQTPLSVVAVDSRGEPSRWVYGDRVAAAADEGLEGAVRDAAALFITCGAGPEGGEATMRARSLALSLDRPVVFAPCLRLDRWRSRAEAAAAANACVPDALLVRATAVEAEVMTGEDDPERAALALLKAGARLVVLTLGAEGAMLRGELRLDIDEVEGRVLSTIGAGDVLTGVLLARLAMSAYYPATVAASLPEAVAEAARACERWGALE